MSDQWYELMTPEEQGQDEGETNYAGDVVHLPHFVFALPRPFSITPEDSDINQEQKEAS